MNLGILFPALMPRGCSALWHKSRLCLQARHCSGLGFTGFLYDGRLFAVGTAREDRDAVSGGEGLEVRSAYFLWDYSLSK